MKKIVIMPGGYHPFHAGHYALYKSAQNKFSDAEIFLAATNDTKTRPFPFEIKKKLAQLAGVSPNNFIQVKSPFRPQEITSKYDPENDILIFVRSEKDRNEEPKPGGTKKDGSPSYFQPYDETNLQPFGKYAYIEYLPTVEFGPGIKSATEIRNSWPNLNERQKLAMVMSLYPATQKNKRLADIAVKMLDAGIIGDQVNEEDVTEAILINDPEEGHVIIPDGGMGTWDEQSLLSNLVGKFTSLAEMIKRKEYTNIYHGLYKAGVIENMLKALIQYERFKAKQGKRPIAKGREIDLSEGSAIQEIDFSNKLDDSNFSTKKLLELGKKDGEIEGYDVMKIDSGSQLIYFLASNNEVLSFIGFENGYLKNIKNVSKQSGVVRALMGYLVHIKKITIKISPSEPLTPSGIKWILHFIKNPQGLVITDQQGNEINQNELSKEWEVARTTRKPGPTGIIITEDENFGNKIRINETYRSPDSLLMPHCFYTKSNQDYLNEK
jgi:hypothetical protein